MFSELLVLSAYAHCALLPVLLCLPVLPATLPMPHYVGRLVVIVKQSKTHRLKQVADRHTQCPEMYVDTWDKYDGFRKLKPTK